MKKFITSILTLSLMTSTMAVTNVSATEASDNYKCIMEFPVNSDVQIYDTASSKLMDEVELDTTVKLYMKESGDSYLVFTAAEDFSYTAENEFRVMIDNFNSKDQVTMSIDYPYWCEPYTVETTGKYVNGTPKLIENEYISDIRHGYGEGTYDWSDCTLNWVFFSTKSFFSMGNYNMGSYDKDNQAIVDKFDLNGIHNVYTDADATYFNVNTDEVFGVYPINYHHNVINSDEDGQYIVLYGEKHYIDDDQTITYTFNGTSVSQDINNKFNAVTPEPVNAPEVVTISEDTPYIAGDLNDNGSVDIADMVILKKWLLGVNTNISDYRTADLSNDGTINTLDLCILKKMLIEK